MGKRVFVSADWKEPYDTASWDKSVVDRIRQWTTDNRRNIEISCTDDVHNSVLDKSDCRRCDIKGECGSRIDWSSIVILVIGDNTKDKGAGVCDAVSCSPAYSGLQKKDCKYTTSPAEATAESGLKGGNKMSYLEFEIKKAIDSRKKIIVVYNSVYNQEQWLPTWYNARTLGLELCRVPFWKDERGGTDCYHDIKEHLQ